MDYKNILNDLIVVMLITCLIGGTIISFSGMVLNNGYLMLIGETMLVIFLLAMLVAAKKLEKLQMIKKKNRKMKENKLNLEVKLNEATENNILESGYVVRD